MKVGDVASPAATITIAKGSAAVASPAASPGYHLQLRVCASCSAPVTTSENVVGFVTDLSAALSASAVVRFFPCSETPGAISEPFKDANGKAQYVCVCPSGTALANGACQAVTSSSGASTCYWDGSNTGYSCKWSSADASSMRLVSDCGAAIRVPTDNYVASGRVNKHDGDALLVDPMIKVQAQLLGSSSTLSVAKTWQEFTSQPKAALDAIAFCSFGVYSLAMTASDYKQSASCSGCVAVVDSVPPRAIQPCATSTWGSPESNPAILTTASLQEAMTKETSFSGFAATSNVKNNAGGSFWDDKTRTMRDFYSSDFTALPSDTSACFPSQLAQSLLGHTTTKVNPLTAGLSEDALSKLTCTRCCSKTSTLKEFYYDYKCGADPTNAEKKTTTGDSCAFGHCLRVQAASLVDASAQISDAANTGSTAVLNSLTSPTTTALDGKTIRRTVPCTSFGGSTCSFSATLGSLFALTTAWKSEFPGSEGTALKHDAGAYVFWRYKVSGDDVWRAWDATTSVKFAATSTTVSLQAWTRCGMVKEFSFSLVQYLHAAQTSACNSFASMWQQVAASGVATAPSTASMCMFDINSNFASLLFSYSGVAQAAATPNTVKSSVKSVSCSIKVTDSATSIATVTGKSLPLTASSSTAIAQYFGIELVSYGSSTTTKVRSECVFTFHPFGIASTDASLDEKDSCSYDFSVSTCSTNNGNGNMCSPGKCSASDGLSACKACKGVVFTATNSAATVQKTSWASCCTDCTNQKTLVCTAVAGVPSTVADPVGRCEMVNKASQLMALVGAEPQRVELDATTVAAGSKAAPEQSTWPTGAALIGASVMVAAVVLAGVKLRLATAHAGHRTATGDAYYALIE